MCVAGMGNGSVGWLKVLTHLTLLRRFTVMKQELCVCLGCVSVQLDVRVLPLLLNYPCTNRVCVCQWEVGRGSDWTS